MAQVSSGIPSAPLEAVVHNDDLLTRPRRAPDHAAEVHALSTLIQSLAESPETILQALVEQMLELFKAESTGISLVTSKDGEERFYWPAIAGEWRSFVGGGTPRDFSPCCDVLAQDHSLLFRNIELRYDYYLSATPRVEECLLSPFYLDGKAVGTVWIVAHSKERQFDSEDLRQLESIARFAATAYRTLNLVQDLKQKSQSLEASEITLRKEVSSLAATSQELGEANADLNHFAYAAGHDLREPLRTVQTSSQLIARRLGQKLDTEDRDLLDSLIDGCRRMDSLVSDLLSYAMAADGDRDHEESVDLNSAFDAAMTNLKSVIREAKASVTCDPLPTIRAHRGHFVQLFQNLLGNAINYRSERPPRIHLAAAREEDGLWHLVFSDNGIGIAPEQHQRIFETFTRLHGREVSGTGLGLAICRRIIQRCGGRIWVESAPGEGSRFHFTVPREAPALHRAR